MGDKLGKQGKQSNPQGKRGNPPIMSVKSKRRREKEEGEPPSMT